MTDVDNMVQLLTKIHVKYRVCLGSHEVSWQDNNGNTWVYYGGIKAGRQPRMTVYNINPERAIDIFTGAR